VSGKSEQLLQLQRALAIVQNHFDEAEEVAWEMSERAEREAVRVELEALTQRIWGLQQDIAELQEEIDD